MLTQVERLRRVCLLCCHLMRNLAYYRTIQDVSYQGDFWVTMAGNCIDVCVLEWCKLFGDPRAPHHWAKVLAGNKRFEAELLAHLKLSAAEFETYRLEMRALRDKFLAHLDSEKTMQYPKLDHAQASVECLYDFITTHEIPKAELGKLPESSADLRKSFEAHQREASSYFQLCKTSLPNPLSVMLRSQQED